MAQTSAAGLQEVGSFGEKRLRFPGPDGDGFALAEAPGGARDPFANGPVPTDLGVRGFRGVTIRLRDGDATAELLRFMGWTGKAR